MQPTRLRCNRQAGHACSSSKLECPPAGSQPFLKHSKAGNSACWLVQPEASPRPASTCEAARQAKRQEDRQERDGGRREGTHHRRSGLQCAAPGAAPRSCLRSAPPQLSPHASAAPWQSAAGRRVMCTQHAGKAPTWQAGAGAALHGLSVARLAGAAVSTCRWSRLPTINLLAAACVYAEASPSPAHVHTPATLACHPNICSSTAAQHTAGTPSAGFSGTAAPGRRRAPFACATCSAWFAPAACGRCCTCDSTRTCCLRPPTPPSSQAVVVCKVNDEPHCAAQLGLGLQQPRYRQGVLGGLSQAPAAQDLVAHGRFHGEKAGGPHRAAHCFVVSLAARRKQAAVSEQGRRVMEAVGGNSRKRQRWAGGCRWRRRTHFCSLFSTDGAGGFPSPSPSSFCMCREPSAGRPPAR